MSAEERTLWAESVLEKLKKFADLQEDEIIFLAGRNYRENLLSHIKNYKIPMQNLGIGRQLKFLKEKTDEQKM
jgi:hypothetical protein